MSRLWRFFLPGYLHALPHTLVGLVIAVVFYRARAWRWSDGCIECLSDRIWGRPNAQTHGWLVVYDSEPSRDSAIMRVHERVHVVQGFLGGPIYVLIYGLMFAAAFAGNGFTDWYRAYKAVWFEKQAYSTEDRYVGRWGT